MQAQHYDAEWKAVADAFNQDLPKTAITHLNIIRDKAVTEGNQPQLLRALCTEFTVAHEISPDSDAVVRERIEAALADCEQKLATVTASSETDRRLTDCAMWQYALGRITYKKEHLLAALNNVELLGRMKAADYVPAIVLGTDSYCFGGDLLSLLTLDFLNLPTWRYALRNGEQCDAMKRMRAYYASRQDTLAVLMTDLLDEEQQRDAAVVSDMIRRIREQLPMVRKQDKAHNAAVAKRLQQWVAEKEQPMVDAHFDYRTGVYPGKEVKIAISSRNVKEMELRLYRVNGWTNECFREDIDIAKVLAKKGQTTQVATIRKALLHDPAHETFKDTLDFTYPAPGIYILQLLADGCKASMQWLTVSRVAPVFFSFASDKGKDKRVHLVDGRSGRPYTETVSLKVRQKKSYGRRESAWKTVSPAADGSFDVSRYEGNAYEMAVTVGDDCYSPVKPLNDYFYYGGSGTPTDVSAQIYSDRAIYRPGQKIQIGGLVYQRRGDDYQTEKDWSGTLVLQNPQRDDIAEIAVSTDDFGLFSGEFQLPEHVVLGSYALVLRGNGVRRTMYVSVEEYKRPTFRVTLDTPDSKVATGKDRWEVGDSITVRGKVDTYAGVPLAETKVQWRTQVNRWFWEENDEDTFLEPLGGSVVTDSEGRFEFGYRFIKSGRYATTVEVLAQNGETQSASLTVVAGTPSPLRNTPDEEKVQLFNVEKSEDGTAATVKVNFSALPQSAERPVHVFYSLVSTLGGVLQHECREINADTCTFAIRWQEAYGDAATLSLFFVKDQAYSTIVEVQRPLPDKRLLLEWSTFRDHLQPGESETWTLCVKHPDGSPAAANVMARLYDASLDAFRRAPWKLHLPFYRQSPAIHHSLQQLRAPWALDYAAALSSPTGLKLSAWEQSMFDYYALMQFIVKKDESAIFECAESPRTMRSALIMSKDAGAAPMMGAVENDAAADRGNTEEANEAEIAEAIQQQVRENFDETAFFLPSLRTDSLGKVAISFTLPESLTQWNFTALAHDRTMDYGLLNDTVLAQKKLMAEVAAPRFLREGDTTDLPVSVRNISGAPCKVDVVMLITDAATGKVLATKRESLMLEDGKAATRYLNVNATKDFKVRVVAKCGDFSDGEERLIPVLSGREVVQTSLPFSAKKAGEVHVDLSALNLRKLMKQDAQCQPVLTVEYCDNPIWNVIRVLPVLLDDEAFSVNDWATRLYAVSVADFLSQRLKGTESAAMVDSLLSSKDIPALYATAYDHLKEFQRGDGGFCWVKGFGSSLWMTTDVAILLARQQKMTGNRRTAQMLQRAMDYLDGEAEELVREMKRLSPQPKGLSEVMLRYLYARQLMGLDADKTVGYLLERAAEENKDLTMYGKSAVAQILKKSHPAVSALALRSLVEHTVSTEEMGRYFDTQRAFGSWTSYKIPTQTMAIESLDGVAEIAGQDAATLQEEMKLWLLQSKRTQQWDNSRASADATYALLHGAADAQGESRLFQTLTPEGCTKRTLTAAEAAKAIKSDSYNINKEHDGLSWGAVYADYTLPVEMVEQSSAGFSLTHRWEVLLDGKWAPLPDTQHAKGGNVKVGQHVRQVLTLKAERDYDFVQVDASRAACLEPLQPLSGNTWAGGAFCYRMVCDSSNAYYFEHLAKGAHEFAEEFIVDRAGTFATGIARVRCTIAPEFNGFAPSKHIIATSK